jgi:DNA-binding NtrC family response regulator
VTSPVNADVDALAGKTVALVGLPADDTAAIVHALEQAHAVVRVLREGDSVPVPSKGPLFDVVVIDAALDWDAEGTDMAVLFVGDPHTIARWTPALHDQAHDFLIAPCDPEEFLLRAGRLVAIH